MKIRLVIILIGVVIFMGLNLFSLRKEAESSRAQVALLKERNDGLQAELMRLNSVNDSNEQFLNELEQSVSALETKMPIETLEKHIPKEMLKDIKPVIERLQFLQEKRENKAVSVEDEHME